MIATVIINGKEVATHEVEHFGNVMFEANRMYHVYHIEELNGAGVNAEVYVDGVQSRMNNEGFITEVDEFEM